VYINADTRDYLVRVWGKTREKGNVNQVLELQDLCKRVFEKRIACVGYLAAQYDFGFGDEFIFVDFPCQRQISRACEVSYTLSDAKPHTESENAGAGLCSACSVIGEAVDKMSAMDFDDSEGDDDDDGDYIEPKVVVKQELFDEDDEEDGEEEEEDEGWMPASPPPFGERKKKRRKKKVKTERNVIECHQMSSNVIKCHQMSSNVIECH
jgi:hypothetical protein